VRAGRSVSANEASRHLGPGALELGAMMRCTASLLQRRHQVSVEPLLQSVQSFQMQLHQVQQSPQRCVLALHEFQMDIVEIGIGIDLAMWMVESNSDLFASVLKRRNMFNVRNL